MPSRNVVPVSFSVKASVNFGETVHVVGNVPALGSWKVDYGVPLVTTPATYPNWSSRDPIPLFKGHRVQYKYAIFSGGVFNRWEETPGLRNLLVAGQSLAVSDDILINSLSSPSQPSSPTKSRKPGDRSTSKRKVIEQIAFDDGIIIALYFLPVKISRKPESKSHSFKNKAFPDETKEAPSYAESLDEEIDSKFYIDWDESALLSRKKSSVADGMRVFYIGVPKCDFELQPSDHDALQNALLPFRCIPVFLSAEIHRLNYQVYCKDTLRQLFHHQVNVYGPLPTRWWHRSLHEAAWQAYCTSNRTFAEKIIEYVNEDDIIWIHGYELLLLPSFLARKLQQVDNVTVGLFIHSPFPSSEIFRTLSVREEILRGMLNADQIGFHLYEYARPFLSCCHRILGIPDHAENTGDKGYLSVDYQGRHVLVTVCHAGTEPDLIRSKITSPRIADTAVNLLNAATVNPPVPVITYENQDQVILVGVDECDYLSGVHFKLKWYESFLRENPQWQNRLCFLQIIIDFISSDAVQYRAEIRNIARRINQLYPRPDGRRPAVCLLEWKDICLEDRIALFSIADIFLMTPLRAGLRLSVLEFTVVVSERQNVPGPWTNGLFGLDTHVEENNFVSNVRRVPTLILSEFTAAFRILPGSLRVNPWRRSEMHVAIKLALTMSLGERVHRHERAMEYCEKHNETGWAVLVLNDIKSSRSDVQTNSKNTHEDEPKANEGESFKFSGVGLGLSFRAIEFRKDFKHINKDTVVHAYRSSKTRLILLDYGGTTVSDDNVEDPGIENAEPKFEFRYRPPGEAIMPSDAMQNALQILVSDPLNQVFIVSGRDRQELETAFASIPGIGLSAEHGSYYSWTRIVPIEKENTNLRSQTPPLIVINAEQEKFLSFKRRQRSNSTSSQGSDFVLRESTSPSSGRRKCVKNLSRSWMTSGDHFDDTWMDLSEQIMDIYTQRTNGTYIERKDSSIVWQFRDAESEFGLMQAKELQDHLNQMLKAFKVEVVSGKGYVEVCPQGVDKGHACSHILSTVWPDTQPDFLLCIGDDIADESMFEFCESLTLGDKNSCNTGTVQSPRTPNTMARLQSSPALMQGSPKAIDNAVSRDVFSVVVGEKPSSAMFYLNDVDEVTDLLSVLAKVSTRTQQRANSLNDMSKIATARLEQNTDTPDSPELRPRTVIGPIGENLLSITPPTKLHVKLHSARISEEEVLVQSEAAAAAVAASKSHLDLSCLVGREQQQRSPGRAKMIASASMPVLSEYFSLDRSLPMSKNIHEYLDSLETEDEGIIF